MGITFSHRFVKSSCLDVRCGVLLPFASSFHLLPVFAQCTVISTQSHSPHTAPQGPDLVSSGLSQSVSLHFFWGVRAHSEHYLNLTSWLVAAPWCLAKWVSLNHGQSSSLTPVPANKHSGISVSQVSPTPHGHHPQQLCHPSHS